MRVHVVSWNLNGRSSNWPYALDLAASDQPDVAVVLAQEAKPPDDPNPDVAFTPVHHQRDAWSISAPRTAGGGPSRWFASAVACSPGRGLRAVKRCPLSETVYEDVGPDLLPASHPGQTAVADIEIGAEHPLTVVSMYGLWERMGRDEGGALFAEATLHRAISDLTPLLQARWTRPWILLAGDFNVWPAYGDRTWDPRFDSVFERLAAYGMVQAGPIPPAGRGPLPSCPCGPANECAHVGTYRHQSNPGATPYQVDFVLASKALSGHVSSCSTLEDWTWERSDHVPIVTKLDLPD